MLCPITVCVAAAGAIAGVEQAPAPSTELVVAAAPLEAAITDDIAVIGRLQVDFAFGLQDAGAADLIEARSASIREAQLLALVEFGRLRGDPARPVNVDRLAASLDAALKGAGVPGARVLIHEVRATSA